MRCSYYSLVRKCVCLVGNLSICSIERKSRLLLAGPKSRTLKMLVA
jgi:hypothetical protein